MAGLSRLLAPYELPNVDAQQGALQYAVGTSTIGLERSSTLFQPPAWVARKGGIVSDLLGSHSITFTFREESEDRLAVFAVAVDADDRKAIAMTLDGDESGKLPKSAPSERGCFLSPAVLKALQIQPAPGALYLALTTALYDLGWSDPDDPGTNLKPVEGWSEGSVRLIGELFGSACYFRRMFDSHVLILQIDHDESELRTLRDLLGAARAAA